MKSSTVGARRHPRKSACRLHIDDSQSNQIRAIETGTTIVMCMTTDQVDNPRLEYPRLEGPWSGRCLGNGTGVGMGIVARKWGREGSSPRSGSREAAAVGDKKCVNVAVVAI